MSDAKKFRTMDWIVGLATTVALAVGAWSLKTTTDHSQRIAVIEDSRFTREDAAQLQLAIEHDLAEPPRWVEERFDSLEKAIQELAREVREQR